MSIRQATQDDYPETCDVREGIEGEQCGHPRPCPRHDLSDEEIHAAVEVVLKSNTGISAELHTRAPGEDK